MEAEVTESVEKAVEKAMETTEPGVLAEYVDNLIPKLLDFGLEVLIALVVYFIGSKLIKFLRKLIKRWLTRIDAEKGVIQFTDSFVKIGLYLILWMSILGRFGIEKSSIVAVIGSAGLAVGLAMQGSLANFAGGVLILLLKPFRVGDYIIEDSHKNEGTVKEIQLFYTTLLTIDNKKIIIPNGTLANSSLTNVTAQDKRRVDLKVGISYSADIKKAKELLYHLLECDEARIADMETVVFVDELADSAVILGLRVWVKTENYWTAKWRITEDIKAVLDANEIEIPFNQLDAHVMITNS